MRSARFDFLDRNGDDDSARRILDCVQSVRLQIDRMDGRTLLSKFELVGHVISDDDRDDLEHVFSAEHERDSLEIAQALIRLLGDRRD